MTLNADANMDAPVILEAMACETALGDAEASVSAMLAGNSGLQLCAALGPDGGEWVPLALLGALQRSLPPRWWPDLLRFLKPLHGSGWGTRRLPILLTSSNYGTDGLYGLTAAREASFAPWSTPQGLIAKLRSELDWGPAIQCFSHACVSAQLGLYQAGHLLQGGMADKVLLVSFDFVGPFVAAGFNALKILTGQMPAPYQDRETGSIGLGDGMAWAVVSKTGTGPSITRQALYNEMYHFTANAPDGEGFQQILQQIAHAIDGPVWVKGHGTGTLEAGKMEAEAVAAQFPEAPLVSWKGALGHTLGSCALVELILAWEAIRRRRIPGCVGSHGKCFTTNVATRPFAADDFRCALLLSNAFGGAHAAMVLRHD